MTVRVAAACASVAGADAVFGVDGVHVLAVERDEKDRLVVTVETGAGGGRRYSRFASRDGHRQLLRG
jgi:hypothetical protein